MNSTLISFTSGIADYLIFASLLAAIFVIIAWGMIKLGKIQAPVYHHMIWLCTLFAVLILPVIWLYAPKVAVPVLPARTTTNIALIQDIDIQPAAAPVETRPLGIQSPVAGVTTLSKETHRNPFSSVPIKNVLACLWGLGFLFMLARLLISWHRIHRIMRSAEPISYDAVPSMSSGDEKTQLPSPRCRPGSGTFWKYWIPAFAGMTARLRIPAFRLRQGYGGQIAGTTKSSRIRFLLSPDVESPLCFGIMQPVILLPKKMYFDGVSEDVQMVLHHELAHIERRDCLINIFQRLIEAVLFFHPFVWYASSQLTQNREILCDHHVLAKGASPTEYIKMLTRIVEQGLEKNCLHAVALFEGKLLSRVRSLLESGNNIQLKISRWAMAAGAIAVLLCMGFGAIRLEAKSAGNDQGTESFRHQEGRDLGPDVVRPKGNCSMSGKVVSAETGEPLDDATVYLFYPETSSPIFIRVASDGSFEFKDIPTGPFSLKAIHTKGFQNAIYDPENNSCGGSAYFSLNEDENRTGIIFRLEPDYSISGKVLFEDGQPLKDSQLRVMAWVKLDEPGGNLNEYTAAGSTLIESDGSYTLDGLDNRPVYVMATEYGSGENNTSQPPCYYPGTVSRVDAEMIFFDNKRTIEGIDIQLTSKGGFALDGSITDENTGDPVPKTLVTVHHADMLFDTITTYTDDQGYYSFESMGPGEFLVHVDAEPWGYVRTRKPITIGAEQVTGLDFTLRQAAIISGNFIDQNGEDIEIADSAYGLAYAYDYPTPEYMSWTGTMNKYSEKGQVERMAHNSFNGGQGDYEEEYMVFPTSGTFIIQGMLPGNTMLRFHPKEEGAIVKQILYNGQDIMETGIETSPGEKIEGVSIVIEGAKKRSSPSNKEKELSAQQLEERKGKGYMGVTIQTISSDLKDLLGLKDTRGAFVMEVAEKSPAAKAGIQIKDVIIAFDGKNIAGPFELRQTVFETTIGKHVKVDILRNGDKKTFDLQVG